MNNDLITFKTLVTFNTLEREMLGLARDGYRQKEMGLFVGRHLPTVKRDWLILLSKLGARTITQAVVMAIQKGIIGAYREQNHSEKVVQARTLR